MNRVLLLGVAVSSGFVLAAPGSSQKPTPGQARELMANVCRGGAATGTCSTCPAFVDAGGFNDKMTLTAVTYGKFLNASDTYALLDLDGCEPHANNYGGSVLLRWQGLTRWTFIKYIPGLRSGDCRTYPARGGRETLLCEGGYTGMGIVDTTLFYVDLAHFPGGTEDRPDYGNLFVLEDSRDACQQTASVQSLTGWQQVRLNADVWPDLRVQVRSGSGNTGLTPDQCAQPGASIPTRAYTLDYTFDGQAFTPTQGTRAVLRQLLRDNPSVLGSGN